MRPIRFRAWHGRGKNMFVINERMHLQLQGNSWKIIDVSFGSQFMSSWDKDSDNVLMQYTGLKDVNGKEIYEGDILTTESGYGYVVWEDAAFAIKSPGSEAVDWVHSSVFNSSEIIGNIYSNPAFLK